MALKHNGTFPSEHQIEQARQTLDDFFTTVTPKVFGVDFDSIDMVDLLTQPDTARLVREAQTHADIGDYSMAMAGLALAFDALLDHYARRDRPMAGESPFKFGESVYIMDEPRVDGPKRPWQHPAEEAERVRCHHTARDARDQSRYRLHQSGPLPGPSSDGERLRQRQQALREPAFRAGAHRRRLRLGAPLCNRVRPRASRADEIRGIQERIFAQDWNPPEPYEQRSWTGPVGGTPETEEVSVFDEV
ncbi:hypothetical protein LT493_11500 [Streptomyces tricolor]|nr:hypothetical protein [Streptomyces tricolor]